MANPTLPAEPKATAPSVVKFDEQQEHTPGPWTLGSVQRGQRTVNSSTPVGMRLAWLELASVYVTEDLSPSEEGEANARLIAAAPDMLAVLNAAKIVLKNRDQDEREAALLNAIKIAIAKAEGR